MKNLQLSRSYFNALARKMGNRQYPRDESLLRKLFVTPNAAAVFIELVTWLPYSKRADGSIYKSDAQLAQVIGCSAKTVERTRAIMRQAGFTIEVKKANGTPTNHYRFDLNVFIAFAAKKLNVKVEQMQEWMFSAAEKIKAKSDFDIVTKSENTAVANDELNSDTVSKSPSSISRNENPQNVDVQFDILPASLTTDEITEKTDNFQNNIETTTTEPSPYVKAVVVDSSSLKIEIYTFAATLKMPFTLTEQLILQYGLERVRDVTKRAVEDPKVRNPGGWAKLALANNYQWAEKVPVTPAPKSYTGGPYAAFIKS